MGAAAMDRDRIGVLPGGRLRMTKKAMPRMSSPMSPPGALFFFGCLLYNMFSTRRENAASLV
jgi:hypothetical protein